MNMTEIVRNYCRDRGLIPGTVSVELAEDEEGNWYAKGHEPVDERWNYLDKCCCGVEGCDGGLRDRLAEWGIPENEVTRHNATINLGGS